MPRQGVFRIARAFVQRENRVLDAVIAGSAGCARTISAERDEVIFHMRHPLMDEVSEGEWPEYTIVVTVLPEQPTKWEFRRLK